MFKLNFTSVQPKVPLYKQSGSGRDTYVLHNSGGFTKASDADALTRSGIQLRPQTSRPRTSSIEGKTVIYQSNGTGRDSYISINSGGFTGRTPRDGQNNGFFGGLRNYDKIRMVPVFGAKDFFGWAQTARRGKDVFEEINRAKVVTHVTERLSQPRVRTPFRITHINTDSPARTSNENFINSALERPSTSSHRRAPSAKLNAAFNTEEPKNVIDTEEVSKAPEQVGAPVVRVVARHKRSKSEMMAKGNSPRVLGNGTIKGFRIN